MAKIKHVGIHNRRLDREPKEKAFAEAWAEQAPRTLPWLLSEDGQQDEVTPRDATVAATIIQWLGSFVGRSFIDEVRSSKSYNRTEPPQ